jgi:hypothetical protein
MTFIPCHIRGSRVAYDVCATRKCNFRCKTFQAQRMAFSGIARDLKALEEYKAKTS